MRIGVLGAGRMGGAIGQRWAAAGHEVAFSYARHPARLAALARAAGSRARASDVGEAAGLADAILLAVPWHQVGDVLTQAGTLHGRVLLDCTLPMNADDTALEIGLTMSGGELLQRRSGARVVKAFNTVPAEFIAAPRRADGGRPPSLFHAGDDAAAKGVAAGLIADAGFEPVDAGPLSMSRYLEPFALLMGQVAYVQEASPEVGYRLVRSEG